MKLIYNFQEKLLISFGVDSENKAALNQHLKNLRQDSEQNKMFAQPMVVNIHFFQLLFQFLFILVCEQDRQCTHNVTLRPFANHCCRREAINITYLSVCARARAML
jgi:uncharacterized membrane protein